MIRWKQAVDRFPDYGLTFGDPDFVAYARAYGAKGARVESAEGLAPALEAAFADGGVHLVVDADRLFGEQSGPDRRVAGRGAEALTAPCREAPSSHALLSDLTSPLRRSSGARIQVFARERVEDRYCAALDRLTSRCAVNQAVSASEAASVPERIRCEDQVMNRLLRGLCAVVACIAVAGCKPTGQAAAPSPPPPAVGVVIARMQGVKPSFAFIGRVKAVNTVQLRARVEGFLEKILFTEGQFVKAGDLLFQIEKTQYSAAVEQAKANEAAAEAQELNAQFQFNRAAELVKTSAGTQATVDTTRAALDSAKANVLLTQAALTIAQENLGYTDISSPVDGRIGLTTYTLGNLVNPASGVFGDDRQRRSDLCGISVSARQIADLSKAHKEDIAGPSDIKVFITLANGEPYDQPGSWNFIANQVDQQTDTLLVRAVFPNPKGRLIDGAYVTVKVEEAEQQPRLVIPRAALLLDQIGVYVLVVDSDGKVAVKRVTTGEAVNTDIAIASGLQAGDRVIVDGLQKVRPGQTVKATEVAPNDGAGK